MLHIAFSRCLMHIYYMNVFVEADSIRTISASPGANVKASKVITAQRLRLGVCGTLGCGMAWTYGSD